MLAIAYDIELIRIELKAYIQKLGTASGAVLHLEDSVGFMQENRNGNLIRLVLGGYDAKDGISGEKHV